MEVSVAKDGEYYRVTLKHGTHTLHSEKLNIATAVELMYQIKRVLEQAKIFESDV